MVQFALNTVDRVRNVQLVSQVSPVSAEVQDYIALLKPRVMSLVVFTGFAGVVVAPGHLHPLLAVVAVVCIAIGAGAAGAINMWYDRDVDAIMTRTCNRPIPAGRMVPGNALGFGILLAIASVVIMDYPEIFKGAILSGYNIWSKNPEAKVEQILDKRFVFVTRFRNTGGIANSALYSYNKFKEAGVKNINLVRIQGRFRYDRRKFLSSIEFLDQ